MEFILPVSFVVLPLKSMLIKEFLSEYRPSLSVIVLLPVEVKLKDELFSTDIALLKVRLLFVELIFNLALFFNVEVPKKFIVPVIVS